MTTNEHPESTQSPRDWIQASRVRAEVHPEKIGTKTYLITARSSRNSLTLSDINFFAEYRFANRQKNELRRYRESIMEMLQLANTVKKN